MKKTYVIKLVLLGMASVLMSNLSHAKQRIECRIEGNIKGLPDHSKLSLIEENRDTLQSITSKDGKFLFNAQNLEKGKLYFVTLDNVIFKTLKQNWTTIIIESSSIKISGNADQWPFLTITGSNSSKVYDEYHKINGEYLSKLNPLRRILFSKVSPSVKFDDTFTLQDYIKADTSSTALQYIETSKKWRRFVLDYIKANNSSLIIPLLIAKSNALSLDDKSETYKTLTDKSKNSYYGNLLREYLISGNLSRKIAIGKEIPDFSLRTPNGKSVSIKKIIEQNKLTLIDFWASWCSPCRAAIPHLKEIYSKYSTKGFSIVGVSSDKDEKAWIKAIVDDGTPWSQGLSVDGKASSLFQIQGIPSYILVDRDGKIIATNVIDMGKGLGTQGPSIRGEKLAETLKSLLSFK